MHRKPKANVVRLAMVAMLASMLLIATSAEASSEPKFTTSAYPATITATGNTTEQFTAFGGETTCSDAEYTGQLTEASTAIEIAPVYSGCKGHGLFGSEIPATVTMNSCKYTFHDASTDLDSGSSTKTHAGGEITHFYKIKTTIHCPLNKAIEVHLYSTHSAHTEGKSFCTITITGETNGKNIGLEGLTVDVTTKTPTNPNDLVLTGTVSGIHAEFHRNSFLCPHSGTTPTTENGQYHLPAGGVTVQGKRGGVTVGLDIGEPTPEHEFKLTAETDGPAVLDLTGSASETFTGFGAENFCEHVEFSGGEIPKGGTTVVSVTPVYTGCQAEGPFGLLPMTITHNGCRYTFENPTTDTSGGSSTSAEGKIHFYNVETTIHCPEGKTIERHVYASEANHTAGKSLCTTTVPGETDGKNTGLKGLTIDSNTNMPASPDDLTFTGTVTGIYSEIHRLSFLCPSTGSTNTTNEGQYHLPAMGITVTGTNGGGEPTSIYVQ